MQKTDTRAEESEAAEAAVPVTEAPDGAPAGRRSPPLPLLLVAAVLTGPALLLLSRWLDEPAMRAWRTVCLAVTVQALPFLLLGTALSGAINAFVPDRVFTRALP
ncbi:permease, partial [Streptomyces sp. NPDC004290]